LEHTIIPITTDNQVVICNSGSALTLTLPSTVGSNEVYYIKNIGAGAVTITSTGPDLIDGASTKVLAQYESANLLDYTVGVWIVL
jgi:hypothetical protein